MTRSATALKRTQLSMKHVKQWGFGKKHEYYELNNLDHQASTVSRIYPERKRPWWRKYSLETWKPVILCGVVTSLVVLLSNVIVLSYGLSCPPDSPGTRVLHKGSCSQTSISYTSWHVLINILSTILLGSSNAASQILAAPTRDEVDKVHVSGKYLHVGVLDLLNLRYISKKRGFMCVLLALSTIPLHLLYNSAIFNSTAVYGYYAILVQPDFLQGAPCNIPPPDASSTGSDTFLGNFLGIEGGESNDVAPLYDQVQSNVSALQGQASRGELKSYSNHDCIRLFGQDIVQTAAAVVLVTKEAPNPNSSFITGFAYDLPTEGGEYISRQPYGWMCNNAVECDASKLASNETWHLLGNPANSPTGLSWEGPEYEVDHCLVREAKQSCTVELSVSLMVVVIVCNAIKLGCFVTCLRMKEHKVSPYFTRMVRLGAV